MRKFVFTTTLFLVFALFIAGCQKDNKSSSVGANQLPKLNLTENALWDNPVYQEIDRDSFYKQMRREYDPRFVDFISKIYKGDGSLKEMQMVYDTLANSKSIYAGYARLITLNRILIETPVEKFTKTFVLKCLNQGYEIAEGKSPVPQSLFFNFWDNCMVGLSNTGAYDEVSEQAQKLLEICESQNLPIGVMFSYRALAGNLQDHHDYSTAIMEYEKADTIARQCMPALFGKDWQTADIMKKNVGMSDFLACYFDMKSQELYCCVNDSNYEWIRKNEKFLKLIVNVTEDLDIVQICMLYNFAQYYDATGSDSMFRFFVDKAEKYALQHDNSEGSFFNVMCNYNYNQTMAYHELKLNHPEKALKYMNQINMGWRTVQNDETYARIYSRLGMFEDAANEYAYLLIRNKEDLNGRNRFTLNSMSANIENKKRDIQMMQAEIDRQHMQQIYGGIILLFAFVLIVVLFFFLYRQHKLNQRLAEALDKAEAANKAKSMFLKNMTHEIHTPIHQIYGFAQVMADRSMPLEEDDIRMMCDAICESSVHLTKLADNIVEVVDKVSDLDDLETTESVLKA